MQKESEILHKNSLEAIASEMWRTGYFSDPTDPLLLARRRLWRAIRGKVDIGLQTGAMDIPAAARYLNEAGVPSDRAVDSARKYPLNPGYQICYTLGLRRFLSLFEQYGKNDLQGFVQKALGQGETWDMEDNVVNCLTGERIIY